MIKYYILSIESLINTFTVMDAGKEITFGLSTQDNQTIFEDVNIGDLLLGFVNAPVNKVKMLFEVTAKENNEKIELIKKVEVYNGVEIKDDTIEDSVRITELVEINKNKFKELYNAMIENQKDVIKEDFSYLYKLSNKEFAFETIKILKESNALNTQNLDVLVSKEKSRSVLKNTFPILKLIQTEEEFSNQLKDVNGLNRYYSEIIEVDGDNYVITNNWYFRGQNGRDTRTPYVEWIKSIVDKSSIVKEDKEYIIDKNVSAEKIPIPHNYLVFGAPGTGKSHLIKELQRKYFPDKEDYERVTFYANYSYANFVGTYKPKMNGKDIVYAYVPGPFTRILEKALKNPNKNYLLIVEEINRANPAAVFGDIFQLLDRKNGTSEYSINTSEDLKIYLAKSFYINFEQEEEKQLARTDLFSDIVIPSNMYIWATMNSADQGVFPMDTAFKRRWNFYYISVDENEDKIKHVDFMAPDGENKMVRVNWNALRKGINAKLSGPNCKVNEDKLLGPFFISNEIMKTDIDTHLILDNEKFINVFKNKVIMYLFEDAAKQKRSEVFSGCDESSKYTAICEAFDNIGIKIFGDEIYSASTNSK